MDEDICRWIMEFLLRQPIADFLINKILTVVPIADTNPRFKKLILLRSIQSEISDASVSETILESLETIESLDRQENIRITHSMKAAYCAVAVECTVKYLGVSTDRQGKYFEAVKRIWRGKIGNLEKSEETELVCDELIRWRDEIETAVWDVKVSKKLLERNTRNDALRLVRVYLGEAWAILGPTFLELAAKMKKKVKEKGNDPEGFDLAAKTINKGKDKEIVKSRRKHVAVHRRHRGAVKIIDCEELEKDDDASCSKYDSLHIPEVSIAQEALKASALELQALVKDPLPDALRMAEAVLSHYQKKAVLSDMARKIANLEPLVPNQSEINKDVTNPPSASGNGNVEPVRAEEGSHGNQSCDHQNNVPKPSLMEQNGTARDYEVMEDFSVGSRCKHDSLPSPQVSLVQEALKASALELQALVKDPLPDALRMAEAVLSDMAKKIANLEPSVQNQSEIDKDATNPPNVSGNGNVEPVRAEEGNHRNQSCDHQNNVPKPSLMERNGTAHAYEWDDSIDGSPEETSNRRNRIHLPTPKRKAVSPLKKYEEAKFAKRRKMKRWSLEEEDALRKAVEKFGKGNWKLILNANRDVFAERTEVDLKDKWRNMTRY